MAGDWGAPYRPPCGGWPAERRWCLGGCEQHLILAHTPHVDSITVDDPGSGYTEATVTITPAAGDATGGYATAEAVIENGEIKEIKVINPGARFTKVPTVTIAGDGVDAEATAVIAGGAPAYENQTLVDLGGDDWQAPTSQPINGGCTSCVPVVGCYPDELVQGGDHERNLYAATGDYVDRGECVKRGFKNVQVMKAWHGRLPFAHCGHATTRYLTTTTRLTYSVTSEYEGESHTYDVEAERTLSVDKTSGKVSQISCEKIDPETTGEETLAAGFFTGISVAELKSFASLVVGCGDLYSVQIQHPSAIFWNSAHDQEEVEEWFEEEFHGSSSLVQNPSHYSGEVRCEVTHSATNLALEYELEFDYDDGANTGSGTQTLKIEVELSDPYTIDDCVDDAHALAAEWPLDDDLLYPWRLSGHKFAPLVHHHEPMGSVSVGTGCTDDCDDFVENSEYTGEVLGKPLPAGYGPHFQFDHKLYQLTSGNWELIACGAWNNAAETGLTVPANCPRWSDYPLGDRFESPGAMVYFDYNQGVVYLQKWSEIIERRPSINFARPCGSDRAVMVPDSDPPEPAWPNATPICGRAKIVSATLNGLVTDVVFASDTNALLASGDKVDIHDAAGNEIAAGVDVVTGGTLTATLAGDQTGAVGHYASSPGGAHWQWNDDQTKGQFVIHLRRGTDGDSEEMCGTYCLSRIPCAPSVVAFTNNGEKFPNAFVLPIGDLPEIGDETWWQGQCIQAQWDPFAVRENPEDDVPLVECIGEPPEGAPALPGELYCGGLESEWV